VEEIETLSHKVQQSLVDYKRLSKVIKLRAFLPFGSPELALACQNDVSEGILNDTLKAFLEQNLPSKGSTTLGVADRSLQATIGEAMPYSCVSNSTVLELGRAIRAHFEQFHKKVVGEGETDFLFKAERSLSHSYSRGKVKFNVHKADNVIIQSISTLDQLDKDINTFAMRVR
jgi:nucleolar protein 56